MLLVPLVTALTQGWAIGWASCPYDPQWGRALPTPCGCNGSRRTLWKLMIAVAAFAIIRSGLAFGWFVAPETVSLDSIVEFATYGQLVRHDDAVGAGSYKTSSSERSTC
jgi:hypothetical protein